MTKTRNIWSKLALGILFLLVLATAFAGIEVNLSDVGGVGSVAYADGTTYTVTFSPKSNQIVSWSPSQPGKVYSGDTIAMVAQDECDAGQLDIKVNGGSSVCSVSYYTQNNSYNVTGTYKVTIKYDCEIHLDTPITVKFDKNTTDEVTGGSIPADSDYINDEEVVVPDSLKRSGYKLLGWSLNKEASSPTYTTNNYTVASTDATSGVITLYAVWKIASYSITYDATGAWTNTETGAAMGSQTEITNIGKVTIIQKENANGYTYFTPTNLTGTTIPQNLFDTDNEVDIASLDKNITYYIVIDGSNIYVSAGLYTITYNANGKTGYTGTLPTDAKKYPNGMVATVSTNTLSLPGYEFVGWNTNSAATTAETFTDGKLTIGTESEIIYAIWKSLAYKEDITISFEDLEYDFKSTDLDLKITSENSSELSILGYTFSYLENPEEDPENYIVKTVTKVDVPGVYGIDFVIQSENNNYFVGGDKGVYTGKITFPEYTAVHSQIAISCYQYDLENGTCETDNTDTYKNIYIFISYYVVLPGYSVTYDDNVEDSSVSNMPEDTNTYLENAPVTLSSKVPVREGYVFIGWDDGTTIIATGGTCTMTNSNVTLKAVWGHECDGVVYVKQLPTSGTLTTGTYFLDEDTTLTGELIVGDTANFETVKICMNGYVLNLNGYQIINYGSLTISDCNNNKSIHYFDININTKLWKWTSSVTENIVKGGVVTGGKPLGLDDENPGAILLGSNADEVKPILTLANVKFVGNTAPNGGILLNFDPSSVVTIDGCSFIGNTSTYDGGVLFLSCELNISNSTFKFNKAGSNGGALCISNTSSLIENCIFENNSAVNGGAISAKGSTIILIDCTVQNNTATGNGAGLNINIENCLSQGTKITMSDGSIKNIEDVKLGDCIKTFDHENGKLSSERVCLVYESNSIEQGFTLNFSTNKVSVVGAHAFLEKSSKKYVKISEDNVKSYVGKYFYNANANKWEKLESFSINNNSTKYYSIYSANHINCIANNMLNCVDDVIPNVNVFDFDDNLKVDEQKKAADIAKYGLCTIEDVHGLVSEQQFDDFNIEYYYVMLGKGLIDSNEAIENARDGYKYYQDALCASDSKKTIADYTSIYKSNRLILGGNIIVTNNKVGEADSNIYLDGSVISVVDGAIINAGVELNSILGVFSTGVYTNDNSRILFTSDNKTYEIFIEKIVAGDVCTYTYSVAHICGDIGFNKVFEATSSLSSGNYLLTENVELTANLEIEEGNTVKICLNGYILNLNEHSIINEGTLYICDCNTSNSYKYNNDDSQWTLDSEGTQEVVGGAIINSSGSAIYNDGIATLKNVNLIGNESKYWGAVITNYGTMTITGGIIEGNYSEGCATIDNYLAEDTDAADLTLDGVTIAYNTSGCKGAGIYNRGKKLTLIDTVIKNNQIISSSDGFYGAGVLVEGIGQDLSTEVILGGNTIIEGNTTNGLTDDLAIDFPNCVNAIKISSTKPLSKSSKILIGAVDYYDIENQFKIMANADAKDYKFVSADNNYVVKIIENNTNPKTYDYRLVKPVRFDFRDGEGNVYTSHEGFTYNPTSAQGFTFYGWSLYKDGWDIDHQTVVLINKHNDTYDSTCFEDGNIYYAVWKNAKGNIVRTSGLLGLGEVTNDEDCSNSSQGWSYDKTNSVLTLENFTFVYVEIIGEFVGDTAISFETDKPYTIVLKGDNLIGNALSFDKMSSLSTFYKGIQGYGSLAPVTITGSGSLTIYDISKGISLSSDLIFDDDFTGDLTICDKGDTIAPPPTCAIYTSANVIINNGCITLYNDKTNALNVEGDLTINGGRLYCISYNNVAVNILGDTEIPAKYMVTSKEKPDGTGDDAELDVAKYVAYEKGITIDDEKYTFTYGDEDIEYTVVGAEVEGFKVYYYVNDEWVEDAPVNVGSYDVKVTRDADNKYKEFEEIVDGGIVINKATFDMSNVKWDYDKAFTYDGTEKEVTLTGLPNGLSVEKYKNNTATLAGQYRAVVTFAYDSNNYNAVSTRYFRWEIAKGTYDMSNVSFSDTAFIYDGNAHSIYINGTLPEGVEVTYDGNEQIEVGTYQVTATFTVDEANYELIPSKEATLVIRYKEISNNDKETKKEPEKKKDVVVETEKGFDKNIEVVVEVTVEANIEVAQTNKQLTIDYNNIQNEMVKLQSNEKVGVIFDVKLIRTIDGVSTEIQPSDLGEGTVVTVKMLIPDSVDINRVNRILHVHSTTNIESIPFDKSKLGADKYYTMTASQFSEFAFVYEVEDELNGSDGCTIHIGLVILFILIIITTLVLYLVLYNKKRKNITTISFAAIYSLIFIILAALSRCIVCYGFIALDLFALIAYIVLFFILKNEGKKDNKDNNALEEVVYEQLINPQDLAIKESTNEEVENAEEKYSQFAEDNAKQETLEDAHPMNKENAEEEDAEDENEEVTSIVYNGKVIKIRYNKSFIAKLILLPKERKQYYVDLANYILSYDGVKNRISWSNSTFNLGRKKVAKFGIKGKTVYLYLPINPDEVDPKYHTINVSDVKKYEAYPTLLKVKSDRGYKYAIELLTLVANTLGLGYGMNVGDESIDNYKEESIESLIDRKLIKIVTVNGEELDIDAKVIKDSINIQKSINVEKAKTMLTDENAFEYLEGVKSNYVGKKFAINIDTLSINFNDGDVVNIKVLKEKGLVPKKEKAIKILARGTLDKKLIIQANDFSADAIKMIVITGGKAIRA